MTRERVPKAKDRQPHVLCVGAAVLDTLFRVRKMPTGQGKVLPYDMLQIAEGMASSAAYAVVRLGGKASLWGAVGDDETGKRIIADLSLAGIDISGMHIVQGARSAVSTILVDDDGERLIVPFYDPELHRSVKHISTTEIAIFDAVLVDVRWPELALKVLETAQSLGKPAILDGDVAADGVIERLGPAASHIVFSHPAAGKLAATEDCAAAIGVLKQRFPLAFISVTAGENGAYWYDDVNDCVMHMTARPAKTVDTLAAGDIFHGAFAFAVAHQLQIEDTMRMSSAAAALKCQVFGGRTGAPDSDQLAACLAQWTPQISRV
ncbi:sugar kinase [Rhizobium mongolense]|uniref:sugar kinase n=1 Tax=Rhizobium mongolense TaxID=57676 RepID=UPI0035563CCD